MSKIGSESAYPVLLMTDGGWVRDPVPKFTGLTRREYFAALAMQGFIAGAACWPGANDYQELARRAVLTADATLAALKE